MLYEVITKGFATPPGVFGITYKARNATLRGEDYETPVNYWIPFNGNIGLHDAVWRKSFGGDIYRITSYNVCYTKLLRRTEIGSETFFRNRSAI